MVDRITMASRRNDGTINETDPVYIGPKDDAVDGVEHQKWAQAVGGAQSSGKPMPDTDFRADAQSEVDGLHVSKHLDRVKASPVELGGEGHPETDHGLVSVPSDDPEKGVTAQPFDVAGPDPEAQ